MLPRLPPDLEGADLVGALSLADGDVAVAEGSVAQNAKDREGSRGSDRVRVGRTIARSMRAHAFPDVENPSRRHCRAAPTAGVATARGARTTIFARSRSKAAA